MILSEIFGTSLLGEVWYLEADKPQGPWVYATKIVTHADYTFYNPRHHPMFDKENGRVIYFEGTYTNWLTGHKNFTPRYDYNQIMYKLDLADERLALPVPVYSKSADGTGGVQAAFGRLEIGNSRYWRSPTAGPILFFAPDRRAAGTVPVCQDKGVLTLGARDSLSGRWPIAFYALPADTPNPPPTTTPLYEYVRHSDQLRAYSIDPARRRAGFVRAEKPLCLVWKNPTSR
jgi:hypothetical protein